MSAVDPDHLISIPDTHMAEGEMQLLQVTLCLHTPIVERAHSNTYTQEKKKCNNLKKQKKLVGKYSRNQPLSERREKKQRLDFNAYNSKKSFRPLSESSEVRWFIFF